MIVKLIVTPKTAAGSACPERPILASVVSSSGIVGESIPSTSILTDPAMLVMRVKPQLPRSQGWTLEYGALAAELLHRVRERLLGASAGRRGIV